MTRTQVFGCLAGASALVFTTASSAFVHFESAPVHPLELSPDGDRLFAAHTVDHRLVIFDLTGPMPVRVADIPVGLEPVAVRARTDDEIWVVNRVSDDISIVKPSEGNVIRTLLAGDEPSDVVFAGTPQRAFVVVSREDRLLVFDPANLDAPPVSVPLAASAPRSLAVSPDGATLWVTVFDSGNLTTAVSLDEMELSSGPPPPNPPMNPALPPPPLTSLIVKHDGTHWVDELGTSWDAHVPYLLLDKDVVRVDVATATVLGTVPGVGTNVFNVAVSPADGTLFVTAQEATNEVRFEPVLAGQFVKSRLTLVDPVSGVATPHDLNGHIDLGNPGGNPVERALSLAIPTDVAVSSDGTTVYVAAFASSKVGVLDAAGNVVGRLDVAAGPCGLALDEGRDRLYALGRIASELSVVELGTGTSTPVSLGFDPRPPTVREGAALFYGGEATSAHGDLACASCHLFGDTDYIAWDLGNPLGELQDPPPPAPGDSLGPYHPMKGPMTTQPLRGLSDQEPFHWRGDRNVLDTFNPAFVSLLGRSAELSPSEMAKFSDFVFSIVWPSNPNRKLDGSLPNNLAGGKPSIGKTFFETSVPQGGGDCIGCHERPSGGSSRVLPHVRAQAITHQDMKIPHLRGLNQKTRFTSEQPTTIRGFGSSHNGSIGDVFPHKLQIGGLPGPSLRQLDRADVVAYLLCFDTGIHPVVGAQWTMDGTNEADGLTRVNTMVQAADDANAGLIAKGRDGTGDARGWVYTGAGNWATDRWQEPPTTTSALLALAGAGTEITFTGVIPGTQWRLGVDRDDDGYRDRDELDGGSDPADPASVPPGVGVGPFAGATRLDRLRVVGANPARGAGLLAYALTRSGAVRLDVYDVSGRLVRPLVHERGVPAGSHDVSWDLRGTDGRPVAGGVYFVRLAGPDGGAVKRITVLR